jgi:hypothetical protein
MDQLVHNERSGVDAGRAFCLHRWHHWPGATHRDCWADTTHHHRQPNKLNMKKKTMLQAFTAFVLLASTPFVGAQQKADNQTNGFAAWTNSFPTFLQQLATAIGKNPTWPDKAPGLAIDAVNGKGETIWLVPRVYPISLTSKASREGSTSKFLWKTVTWDLTVDSIETGKAGNVIVNFKKQDLALVHPSIKEFQNFHAVVAESQRDQARKLKPGQAVRVRGKIDGEIMGGLTLLLGVGPNARRIAVIIVLSQAELLEPKKP